LCFGHFDRHYARVSESSYVNKLSISLLICANCIQFRQSSIPRSLTVPPFFCHLAWDKCRRYYFGQLQTEIFGYDSLSQQLQDATRQPAASFTLLRLIPTAFDLAGQPSEAL
jgi:hypothetical protein